MKGDVQGLMAQRLRAWADEALQTLRAATPVRTGHLQRSWEAEIGPTDVTITNSADYARFVIEGTRPRARAAAPLALFLATGDVPLVRSHPGYPGSVPLQEAIRRVLEGAQEIAVSYG